MTKEEIIAALPPTPDGTTPFVILFSSGRTAGERLYAVLDRESWGGESNHYLGYGLIWVPYLRRTDGETILANTRERLLAMIESMLKVAPASDADVADDECW